MLLCIVSTFLVLDDLTVVGEWSYSYDSSKFEYLLLASYSPSLSTVALNSSPYSYSPRLAMFVPETIPRALDAGKYLLRYRISLFLTHALPSAVSSGLSSAVRRSLSSYEGLVSSSTDQRISSLWMLIIFIILDFYYKPYTSTRSIPTWLRPSRLLLRGLGVPFYPSDNHWPHHALPVAKQAWPRLTRRYTVRKR